MLQLLNRSYEARYLGGHALTSAVTGEALTRLVSELPAADPGSDDGCTVLCCASGLIVTRRAGAHDQHAHPSVLRVCLADILFCHVDRKRPEVTVWVVREDDEALKAYAYRCADGSDALSLFQVYSEMSQHARLSRRSGSSEGWNSVTEGIENAGLIRRKDREMKAAMLEELRDTLRTRYGFDVTSELTLKKPLKDVSNTCDQRQRKPAKVLEGQAEVSTEVTSEPDVMTAAAGKSAFQFPRSVGDMVKRLVSKTGKDAILKDAPEVKAEMMKKKKTKKSAQKDFEPEPVRIPNRISHLSEPYFYLSEGPTEGPHSSTGPQPAWVHHRQVIKDICLTRNASLTKRMSSGVKKKVHGKKGEAFRSAPAVFVRSSSTASNGSSGSDSGPELRSVMKKPKQSSQPAHEGKKNVTFHAYATVQVLP